MSATTNASNSHNLLVAHTYHFSNCWKWKFSLTELYNNKSTRSLTYNLTGEVYEIGNYDILADGESVLLCIPQVLNPQYSYWDTIAVSFFSLSMLCLIVAFYQHLKTSRQSKYYHDPKPMLCHMGSLFLMYTSLTAYQTLLSITSSIAWKVLFTTCHIVIFLSAISWLNVITFDIWRQFHPKNVMIQFGCTTRGFVYRCVYAHGLPSLIALLVVVPRVLMTSIYSVMIEPAAVKKDWLVQVFFMGGFALFNFINLGFCLLTLINVRKAKKSMPSVNTTLKNKSILRIGMNLFIVSGFSFVCGIIGHYLRQINYELPLVLDTALALQGVLLLIVYGYKDLRRLCSMGIEWCVCNRRNVSHINCNY